MSNEQIRRVNEAIQQTERLLSRELAYSAQFQNAALIDSYRSHLAMLNGMVA